MQFFESLVSVWQNFKPTLAIFFTIWQIFIGFNGETLNKYCSYLVTLLESRNM